jgi:hypothetical protein
MGLVAHAPQPRHSSRWGLCTRAPLGVAAARSVAALGTQEGTASTPAHGQPGRRLTIEAAVPL